jgi:hypothetical protein
MMAHPIKRKPLSAGQYQPVVSPVPSDSAMSDGLDIISKSHIESNQSPSKLLLGLDQNIELDHYPVNSSKPSISPTVSSYAHLADPSSTAQGTTWKIYWHQPTFIIATLLCGFALALAHHFYYNSMSGSTAGDAAKQAWPIRFGTAFAFLVIACLRAATASALGQYAWTIVRRRPLKICKYKLF